MHFAIPAFTFILGYLLMGSTPSEAKVMRVNQLGNQFNPMFKFMPSQRLSQQNRRDQVLRSWRQKQMCLARCKRQAEENPDKVVLRAERSIREKRQCGGGCGGGCGCCNSCCTSCCNSCCSCGCQSNPIVILVPNNDCGCNSCGCSSCGCSSCCQSCCCSPCCSCGGCSSCGGC